MRYKVGQTIRLAYTLPGGWSPAMKYLLGKIIKITKIEDFDSCQRIYSKEIEDWCVLSTDIVELISSENISENLKQTNMKAMKKAVLATAQELCEANNTVTTLEIKVELRRELPYYYWDQATVSTYMDQLAGDGLFTYTDNGTYRTYSLDRGITITSKHTGAQTSNFPSKTLTNVTKLHTVKVKSPKKDKGVFTPKNKSIKLAKVIEAASSSNFESFTLDGGITVPLMVIKGQKKSPRGYITPKLHKVKAVTLGGVTYKVRK